MFKNLENEKCLGEEEFTFLFRFYNKCRNAHGGHFNHCLFRKSHETHN